jgi:ABC-type transporter MlaC component
MKKIILGAAMVLFAIASMAQTKTTPDPAKVSARQAVKSDVQTLKQDQKTFIADKKANNTAALAADKQKAQADRATLKTAVKQAKAVGVKQPLKPMVKQAARRRQAMRAQHK